MSKRLFIQLSALLICIYFILPSFSFASVFNNAYLRLNSQKPNANLSGTVCAQPSSPGGGTEAKVVVEFPSDFTVSSGNSDWTTSISNLPAGSTPWPGIGATASNVSGKGVTFASSDLTSSVLYCFNFAGASSTTGSVGEGKVGAIATKNSSNTLLDLTTYAVAIVGNDEINVTASVDPQISDLPITIQSDDSGTQFPQNTTLSYTIAYGTNTTGSIPLTIQAQWSRGTITGSPTPSVDLLDYVIGSASNGYGSTPSIIDTVNRTITWTISSIPGNTTNQTVTFKLKTNDSYTGNAVVDFKILARATSGTTATPDKEVDQSYLFDNGLVPTSTPTSTSTPTPTPGSSGGSNTTPTPKQAPKIETSPFIFNEISIRGLSQNSANIFIDTSANSVLTVKYGTLISNLSETLKTATYQNQTLVTIPNLSPKTDYYFKVSAKNASGNIITSDIFIFTTASVSNIAEVNINSLVAASNNIILVNPALVVTKNLKIPPIILPVNSEFGLQFSLNKSTPIKNIKLIIRNSHVLGISSFGIEQVNASSDLVDMVETQPGVYTGKLASKPTPGLYDVYVRISDYNGNITEQKIADLKVSPKLTILEKGTKNPIENAFSLLYLYNYTSKTYGLISPQILPIPNPVYSQFDGSLNLVLPIGKYKAEITTVGYKAQTIEFEINKYSNYPTIFLQKERFNILNTIKYYLLSINDLLITNGKTFVTILGRSLRFFDLVSGLSLLSLVILAFFAFSKRHSIPLSSLYSYFFYLLDRKAKNENYVHGVVYDEDDKPIVGANIYLTDKNTEEIISNTKTNQNGEFYFKKGKGEYLIMATKAGYHPTPLLPYEEKAHLKFKINLKKSGFASDSFDKAKSIVENIFGMSFEVLLILSFIFEVVFLNTFGAVKTLPFLILSLFNLSLWILHLSHKRGLHS